MYDPGTLDHELRGLGDLGLAPLVIPLITAVSAMFIGVATFRANVEQRRAAELISRASRRETLDQKAPSIQWLPIVAIGAAILALRR